MSSFKSKLIFKLPIALACAAVCLTGFSGAYAADVSLMLQRLRMCRWC